MHHTHLADLWKSTEINTFKSTAGKKMSVKVWAGNLYASIQGLNIIQYLIWGMNFFNLNDIPGFSPSSNLPQLLLLAHPAHRLQGGREELEWVVLLGVFVCVWVGGRTRDCIKLLVGSMESPHCTVCRGWGISTPCNMQFVRKGISCCITYYRNGTY